VDVASCDRARAERFLHRTAARKFTLYLGRNDPVKNPVDFVRLACLLPGQSFVMAGEGLSEEVLTQEWNVDVPHNLTVLGALSHQEAQDAIAACEVLVMTSKREGLPTLALEGQVQRKPVIVPDESGCLEAVGHGERGFIYPQGNIDQLAECTLRAHRDVRNVEAIRQSVVGEYSWPVVMRKLDEIYRGAACP
jgi:glycosyltransferase involved in cell wall biosynthesis